MGKGRTGIQPPHTRQHSHLWLLLLISFPPFAVSGDYAPTLAPGPKATPGLQ